MSEILFLFAILFVVSTVNLNRFRKTSPGHIGAAIAALVGVWLYNQGAGGIVIRGGGIRLSALTVSLFAGGALYSIVTYVAALPDMLHGDTGRKSLT